MATYLPDFKKQLTGTKLGPYNCNMAAAAMLADAATLGIVNVSADAMRRASGRDEPAGTTIADALTALAAYGVHPTGYDASDGLTYGRLLELVSAGRSAIVHGDYDAVPTALRGDKDFEGYHSVFLAGLVPSGATIGDPLNDGRRPGIPRGWVVWPLDVLRLYMERFPGAGLTAAIMRLGTATVRVPVANVRAGPSRSSAIITRLRAGRRLRASEKPDLGESVGGDRRWWRVLLPTGGVAWMHASVVLVTSKP
jgi:hypothetical protein